MAIFPDDEVSLLHTASHMGDSQLRRRCIHTVGKEQLMCNFGVGKVDGSYVSQRTEQLGGWGSGHRTRVLIGAGFKCWLGSWVSKQNSRCVILAWEEQDTRRS